MLKFIQSNDFKPGANKLYNLVYKNLSLNKKVLWSISGGSNIEIESYILKKIPTHLLKNLFLILADERFVNKESNDSNYIQFLKSIQGRQNFHFEPILINNNLKETKKHYLNIFNEYFEETDIHILQAGIGKDGHTLGVLPHSPIIYSNKIIESYQGKDFSRLTLTLKSISKFEYIFIFCFGKDKKEGLNKIYANKTTLEEIPGLIYQQIKSVKLYNDYIGD